MMYNMPFYPYPLPPQSAPNQDPVTMISGWIKGLEELKKTMKDEKKEEKKKPETPSIFAMMLLMLLISPVTGPGMYYFFQMSLRLLPVAVVVK